MNVSLDLSILSLIIGGISLIGLALILKFLRDLRKDLSDEIRMQIKADEEPSNVSFKQPVEIEMHDHKTPLSRHKELSDKVDQLARKTDDRLESLYNTITTISTSIARIEGKLERK